MVRRFAETAVVAFARRVVRPRDQSSAVTTVVFVLAVLLVAGVLIVVGRLTQTSGGFAELPEYLTWSGLGGLTAGVWAVAAIAGLAHLEELTRSERRRARDQTWNRLWLYAGAALLLTMAILGMMLLLGGGDGFDVGLDIWPLLRVVIPTFGIAAAVPWIVTVWWTHDHLATAKSEIEALSITPASTDLPRQPLHHLLTSWVSIERSTAAFTSIVAVGVLTTGSLRLAIIADRSEQKKAGVEPGDLPRAPSESDVLTYGLFFAVLVATVVVPLLLSYRRRARQLVTTLFPPEGRIQTAESVTTLEELLHLNSGPLRSPWAVIGILTPVVTSALAVYLPGLAS